MSVSLGDGRQARTLAGDEPQIGPKRLRQKQDVGKQNGRVEPVAPDRLQGNLGGEFGIVAQATGNPPPRPAWPGIPAR